MKDNITAGLVGFGNRMKDHTLPALLCCEKLEIMNVATKTNAKKNVIEKAGYKHYSSISEPFYSDLDVIFISVPANQINKIIAQLKNFKGKIITETPVALGFFKAIKQYMQWKNNNIYYLEQFPFTPVELVKNHIIKSGLIGRVVYAENCHRSFAYHGIAQLRQYFNDLGVLKDIQLIKSQIPETNEKIRIACLIFSKGIIKHEFSEDIKKSNFRPRGGIKIFGTKGSIDEHAVYIKGEKIEVDFSYDNTKNPAKEIRFKNKILWKNKYKELNHSQHGLFHLVNETITEGHAYTIKDATTDTIINKVISLLFKINFFPVRYMSVKLINKITSA